VWLGSTAVLLPSMGVVAIGIGNLAGALVEASLLNRATRRMSGVAPYRAMAGPLAVAVVSGGLGLLLCTEGPSNLLTVAEAAVTTLTLAALGLWVVCRRDLADTFQLASGSLRSAVPGLRKTSAEVV
jgi:hypothetical protein